MKIIKNKMKIDKLRQRLKPLRVYLDASLNFCERAPHPYKAFLLKSYLAGPINS